MKIKLKYLLLFFIASNFLLLSFNSNIVLANGTDQSREAAIEKETAALKRIPGSYPVIISYEKEGELVKEEIYITITGEHTQVMNGIAINADSFALAKDQIENLTKDNLVQMAGARAWNIENAEPVSIIKADIQLVKPEVGEYPVTFYTIENVSTTIYVNVVLDKETADWFNLYDKNNALGDFEDTQQKSDISWQNFENKFIFSLQLILLILLFAPILSLFIQYLLTTKLVKQVIKLVIK